MADDPAEWMREAVAAQQAEDFAAAEDAYRRVLAADPDNPLAQHNLAALVARRGDPQAALDILDALLAAEPGYVSAHYNRANALQALGRAEDAILAHRAVVALDPDHHASHRALGFLWLAAGDRDRALDHFARTCDLRRGEDRTGIAEKSLRTASAEKLRHDAALFRHLPPRARDGRRFEMLARLYDGVAADLPEDGIVDLSDEQLDTLGADYNAAIHLVDAPEIFSGAIRRDVGIDFDSSGIAVFDDLLTPKALASLRRFLTQSTIWHDFAHIGGFVATYLEDGLACPLVLQIADEFRAALPDILGPHPLTQAWAFKALTGDRPIELHADDAAISLNFWVTPDAANRNPDTGGLVVCRTPPPADWPILDYDADRARIRDFLAANGDSAATVPYRENRGVLFESRLFHGTDRPDFAPGYENHRINITMLFGVCG